MLCGKYDILLVIPAYCEHERLPPFLNDLVREFQTCSHKVHILIVDDGSPAASRRKLGERIKVGTHKNCSLGVPISLDNNSGKGAAILRGWREGIDAHVYAFVDADGAIPAYEVVRLCTLALADKASQFCLFATRIKMLGHKIHRRPMRHFAGRTFATVVNTLFRLNAYDTQCGLKIIPRSVFVDIEPLLQGVGLCFDVELMLVLRGTDAALKEIPIDWEDRAGGQVSVSRHGVRMLLQIILLYFRFRV